MHDLCPESRLQTAPNWSKIRKLTMTSQFSDMASTSNFLTLFCLVTTPSFMSILSLILELWQIFFYKGLTRNPEIGNTTALVFPNIYRLERVMNTKLGTNAFNRMLLNAENSIVIAFTVFELLWENQGGWGWSIITVPLHSD